MKKLLVLLLISLFGLTTFAQSDKQLPTAKTQAIRSKMQTTVIQTNGVCQKCADLFKENVPYFKGVKDYSYDLKTSKITVTFDPAKTTVDAIRKSISMLGYDADNVKANAEARAKLPACCRATKGATHQCPHSHSGCGHQH